MHETGRTLIIFSLMLYFIRLLDIFTLHRVSGPKLVMIGRMVKDVMVIWTMLLVIALAYSIAIQALTGYIGTSTFDTLLRSILRSHWTMFGEFQSTGDHPIGKLLGDSTLINFELYRWFYNDEKDNSKNH